MENRGAVVSFVWVSSQSISPSLWNLVMCFKEKNDFFTIYPQGVNTIEMVNELSVFNRYGRIVFENYSFQPGIPEFGWDGSKSGKEMPSDIYYYSAYVQFINGISKSYTGYLSLLR